MENILNDLFNKQQLVADYLVKNYAITTCSSTMRLQMVEKYGGKVSYGNEIIDDIKLFYQFDNNLINTVVDEWIKPFGLKRNDKYAWVKPIDPYHPNFRDQQHPFGNYEPYNIDDGPRRLETTYSSETIRRLDGDREAEMEMVHMLANQIIIELADERASRSLHGCISFRGLEETLSRLGFERHEQINPTMWERNIRWVESPREWERRRHEYYNRGRVNSHLEIERERLNIQRQLIERNHYERAHRFQAEDEQRRTYEYERERGRYNHIHRGHNLF